MAAEKPLYHHGDLRRALLDAARRVMARSGAERISLRGIAREAGVSHAAPYHHFSDRAELLAALATSGFDALREAMEAAASRVAEEDPLGRLQRCGVAYVEFAVAEPELFRLMFSGPMSDRARFPDLQRAADEAFGVLERLLGGPGGESGGVEMPPTVAIAAWSTVHGLAMLLVDGRIPIHPGGDSVESVVEAVTKVLGGGLRSFTDGYAGRGEGN